MGTMIDGTWHSAAPMDLDEAFKRRPSTFLGRLERAEPNRFHLYVMRGCPWAHRTHIYWTLKSLQDVVSISFLSPRPDENGWLFDEGDHRDPVGGRRWLHEIYAAGAERYTGRVTVPVLFDKVTGRIVNNESAEIIRIFNDAFDKHTGNRRDFYPEALRGEIDELNENIYEKLNNGVYRAGFAQTEAAHLSAREDVFAMLDALEQRLEGRDVLVGDQLTEADWRLFPTLVRFDAAYVSAFRCNVRRLVDYPNLWRYTRRLFAEPGIAATVADPMLYRRGYHSIPIAIGHNDPMPTSTPPSFD